MSTGKRILLVNPPFYRLLGSHYNGLPLGLAYIASSLKENGHDCAIFNADYIDKTEYANQVEIFRHGAQYRDIHADTEHPLWTDTAGIIARYRPDIVGFFVYTANVPGTAIIAGHVKKSIPDVMIVVGGPHAILAGRELLSRTQSIDVAARCEGEPVLTALASGRSLKDIPGISYRRGSELQDNDDAVLIEDLDSLPFPERESFFPRENHCAVCYLITSRGCPWSCQYCASPLVWKNRVRTRSADNVLAELRLLRAGGTDFVQFQDDCFTFGRERLERILNGMLREDLKMRWVCEAHLLTIDADLLALMRRAGCIRIKIGVESGSEEILARYNKKITPQLVMDKARLIRESGISMAAYLMAGFPGETNRQVRQTIELARKIQADYYSLSIVTPYFGTQIYREFVADGTTDSSRDHWEYFFHQNDRLLLTDAIDDDTLRDFLSLNEHSRGNRI